MSATLYIGELRPGDQWAVLSNGNVLICNPDRPPEVIDYEAGLRTVLNMQAPAPGGGKWLVQAHGQKEWL